MFVLSHRSIERLKGVDPMLVVILADAIRTTPYDFGVAWMGGFRTAEEQNKLYQQGRTTEGKKITNADGYKKKSKHQSGNAVDLVCYRDGAITWNQKVFAEVMEHIMEIAKKRYDITLTWGGKWGDSPHIQL